MTTNENLIEVLNDLVEINNDRIIGYEKATKEAKDEDVDLKTVFTGMANESRDYVSELRDKIMELGGDSTDDTTSRGKIYRAWMDVKALFTGSDRKALLSSCEFGEDAAQRAYETALSSNVEIDADSRQLIIEQKEMLKKSHDIIKNYRDMHEVVA